MGDGAIVRCFGATRCRLAEGESRRALQPNDYGPAAVQRVYGVEDQIDEELLEVISLSVDHERRVRELESDVDAIQRSLAAQQLNGGANDVVDVDGARQRRPRAGVVEQAAHD